jgi:hypothetical protein
MQSVKRLKLQLAVSTLQTALSGEHLSIRLESAHFVIISKGVKSTRLQVVPELEPKRRKNVMRVTVEMSDNETKVFENADEVTWRVEPDRVMISQNKWQKCTTILADTFVSLTEE